MRAVYSTPLDESPLHKTHNESMQPSTCSNNDNSNQSSYDDDGELSFSDLVVVHMVPATTNPMNMPTATMIINSYLDILTLIVKDPH